MATSFRTAYSNLIKAVWSDANVKKNIEANPALLSKYGFDKAPKAVRFVSATGTSNVVGYEQQQDALREVAGTVTIYVPPAPQAAAGSAHPVDGDVTACCCCCPCCTCT
jgi:hypothetical protein